VCSPISPLSPNPLSQVVEAIATAPCGYLSIAEAKTVDIRKTVSLVKSEAYLAEYVRQGVLRFVKEGYILGVRGLGELGPLLRDSHNFPDCHFCQNQVPNCDCFESFNFTLYLKFLLFD
jgi:hypothetical protein